MNMFRNMKIGKRLALGFGLMLLLLIASAGISLSKLAFMHKSIYVITEDKVPKIIACDTIGDNINQIARSIRNIIIFENKDEIQKELDKILNTRKKNGEIIAQLEKVVRSDKGRELFKGLIAARAPYNESVDKVLKLIASGATAEAKSTLLTETRKVQAAYFQATDAMIDHQRESLKKSNETSEVAYKNALYMVLGFALLSIIMSVLIAYWITRSITEPLKTAVDAANRLSEGDLTVTVEASGKDETGMMLTAMKNMIESLRGIVNQTKESSSQVSLAADQIAEANQSFSQKVTEQAASVEETTATMEEMTATVKSTADNALSANKLAQDTKSLADSGSTVMTDTISAMDEINKSSSKIANISNVIEEIAFQTNLLALNAAVEAARAGEHGKGFAVVASEIRSLAGRAGQSAKEITILIEDSVDKTSRGVRLAQELSKKLEEIGTGIKKVTDLMDEVAAAASEQFSAARQVNTAMTQIDQVTQQNAALVEETSAAAEELSSQAQGLLEIISFFKLDEARSATVSGRKTTVRMIPAGGKSIGYKKTLSTRAISAKKAVAADGIHVDFSEF